jgi:hypothetical protein
MPAHGTYALPTLSVALLFGAIFLFGGKAAYRPGKRGRRRFLSFAGGISVGYTFVHVLPALGTMRDIAVQSPTGFRRFFPEYSVYLWTMAGFMVFYGLETMVAGHRRGPENRTGDVGGTAPWEPWVHVGGFALYAWLLTYLMVWTGKRRTRLEPIRGGHGHAHLPDHLQPERPLPGGVRPSRRLPAGAGIPCGLWRPDWSWTSPGPSW